MAQQAVDAKPPLPDSVLEVYGKATALLTAARSDLDKLSVLLAEAEAAPGRLAVLQAQLQGPLPGDT